MNDLLDNAGVSGGEPKLIVRKASYAPIWSVWAVLEDTPSEESSKSLLRKMRQAGSIPADDHGLKNGGENALPSASYAWLRRLACHFRSACGGTSTSVAIRRNRGCCSGPFPLLRNAPSSMCESRPPAVRLVDDECSSVLRLAAEIPAVAIRAAIKLSPLGHTC